MGWGCPTMLPYPTNARLLLQLQIKHAVTEAEIQQLKRKVSKFLHPSISPLDPHTSPPQPTQRCCAMLCHTCSLVMPHHPMPCCAMLCHTALWPWQAIPCHSIPCHSIPCHAFPCHAFPCHAFPCHAFPCRAFPCHAFPCCSIPCCATPALQSCHSIPCHSMPCHICFFGQAKPSHAALFHAMLC